MSGILVTGATGNVGRAVLASLGSAVGPVYGAVSPRSAAADGTVRADVLDTLRSARDNAEARVLDFTGPSTWEPALRAVSSVFLVRPPHISRITRDLAPFIRFMAEHGVQHVVFFSVQGAGTNRIVPHHAVERTLRDARLPSTFLRPSFFMQNLTTTHLPEIRDERRIFVPAGDGLTNFIDVRDIADVAALSLADPSHAGAAWTLTGDRSYTYHEIAAMLTEVLGVPVRYEPARLLPFLSYQRSQGRGLGHALVMYALYSVTRMGKAGTATDDFTRVTGRRPRSMRAFIEEHRELLLGVERP